MRTKAIFVAMLLPLAPLPSVAQDVDAGLAAYLSGDNASAMRVWKPLAEQSNAYAQYYLGLMYLNGHGVPQDYVMAHMWANIAAANGHENAVEARAFLEKRMTVADISEAQRRARVCMETNYQDCG